MMILKTLCNNNFPGFPKFFYLDTVKLCNFKNISIFFDSILILIFVHLSHSNKIFVMIRLNKESLHKTYFSRFKLNIK